MKRNIFLSAGVFALAILATGCFILINQGQALAQNEKGEIKVRVFVHYPDPHHDKPQSKIPACEVTINDQIEDYGLVGWSIKNSQVVYQLNYATRPANLSLTSVQDAVKNAFNTWDDRAENLIFTEGVATSKTRYQLDGVNLVAWGSVPNNAIGVTYTWYYSQTGEWVESDTILNKRLSWAWTPYSFDCAGLKSAYDVQNIMTHENGHWIGLDDLYSSIDKDLTMYGYGVPKELKKDTLGLGDILGISIVQ